MTRCGKLEPYGPPIKWQDSQGGWHVGREIYEQQTCDGDLLIVQAADGVYSVWASYVSKYDAERDREIENEVRELKS